MACCAVRRVRLCLRPVQLGTKSLVCVRGEATSGQSRGSRRRADRRQNGVDSEGVDPRMATPSLRCVSVGKSMRCRSK